MFHMKDVGIFSRGLTCKGFQNVGIRFLIGILNNKLASQKHGNIFTFRFSGTNMRIFSGGG